MLKVSTFQRKLFSTAILSLFVTTHSIVAITFASSSHAEATCASGGPCSVGDTGPGGGIVFYVNDNALITARNQSTNTPTVGDLFALQAESY